MCRHRIRTYLTVLCWNPGGGCGGAAQSQPLVDAGSENPANGWLVDPSSASCRSKYRLRYEALGSRNNVILWFVQRYFPRVIVYSLWSIDCMAWTHRCLRIAKNSGVHAVATKTAETVRGAPAVCKSFRLD